MAKNVICLWYDGTAEEAARFYAQTFPDSAVTAVHRAPGDYPAPNAMNPRHLFSSLRFPNLTVG